MKKYLLLVLCTYFFGCEEQKPSFQSFPVIKTSVFNANNTGAEFEIEILQEGIDEVTSFGFVWDDEEPLIEIAETLFINEEFKTGVIRQKIDFEFENDISYEIRAFATYNDEIVYGNTETILIISDTN